MNSPLIGFIGCGEIARMHARCLLALGARIGGGYDRVDDAARLFAQAYGGRKYDTAEQLCADADLDAVYICTRHDSHPHFIAMAANNDKPIFCEKPLALDYEAAKQAYEVVRERNVKFMLGYNHRYSSGVASLKRQLLNRGDHFDVMNINFVTEPFLNDWPGRAEEGGGVFVCLGSHVFDLVHYLCAAEITDLKVTALRQRLDGHYLEDTFGALLTTDRNQLITISSHDHGNANYFEDPGHNVNVIHVSAGDTMMIAKTSSLTLYEPHQVSTQRFHTDKANSWGYQEINAVFLRYIRGEETNVPDIQSGLFAAKMVETCKNLIG